MNRTAASALDDADLVVLVVEALRWYPEDDFALRRAGRERPSGIASSTRSIAPDRASACCPTIEALAKRHDFRAIVPISATSGDNLDRLKQTIAQELPESPPLFGPEDSTDKPLTFRIAETIREKLTLELNQEVPYGIAVEVESIGEEDGQKVVSAVIWVDREGQKPIVIGAGGERLKRVGSAARRELNALSGERYHLTLWVKVRENWADNAQALKALGLE